MKICGGFEGCLGKTAANVKIDRCFTVAMVISAMMVIGGMCWLSYGTTPAMLTMHHPAMLLIICGTAVPLMSMIASMIAYCKGRQIEGNPRMGNSDNSKPKSS